MSQGAVRRRVATLSVRLRAGGALLLLLALVALLIAVVAVIVVDLVASLSIQRWELGLAIWVVVIGLAAAAIRR